MRLFTMLKEGTFLGFAGTNSPLGNVHFPQSHLLNLCYAFTDILLECAYIFLPIIILYLFLHQKKKKEKILFFVSFLCILAIGLVYFWNVDIPQIVVLYLKLFGKIIISISLWILMIYFLYSMPFWMSISKRLKSEQMLSEILNHTVSMIFVLDTHFSIMFANNAAKEKERESKEPFLNRSILDLFSGNQKDQFNAFLKESRLNLTKEREPNSSIFFKTSTGRYVTAHLQVLSPQNCLLQKNYFYLLTLNDVTDLECARQELDAHQRQLEEILTYNRSVFHNIKDGLMTLFPDGTIDQINPMVEKLLGQTSDQLKGQKFSAIADAMNIQDLKGNNASAGLENLIESSHSNEFYETFECRLERPNGGFYVIQMIAKSILQGAHRRCLIILHDLTERKEYEEQLKSNQDLLSQIADNIDAVLFITSGDGTKNLYCSPNIRRLFGVDEDKWRTGSSQDLFSWVQPALAKQSESSPGRFFDHIEEINDLKGKRRYINVRSFIVRDEQGEIYRIAGIAIDITDIHLSKQSIEKQREKLLQKNKELKIQNSSLEQFTYIASHDLGTPLRAIHSYAQLLEEMKGRTINDEGKTYFRYIYSGINRMRELIDGVLSLSKLQMDPAKVMPLDMAAILNDLTRDLKYTEFGGPYSVWIKTACNMTGHETLIKMLFKNLIENGIKYNKSEHAFIQINASETANGIIYEVSDNGIGIENDNQKRIFQIFQRLHSDKDYPGTGIGLATCRRIIELHNGRIWVRSEVGRGSCFYCYFPKKQDFQEVLIQKQKKKRRTR